MAVEDDTINIQLKLYPKEIVYLPLDQSDKLDLKADSCQDATAIGTQGQKVSEIPEGFCTSVGVEPIKSSGKVNPEISTSIPVPKRYAHLGKRRRSYTEELFRCQFTDMISRSSLVCNHLLWKNRPHELREHLLEHLDVEKVNEMDDAQVLACYADAKRIFLEGIPEDIDEEDYEDE